MTFEAIIPTQELNDWLCVPGHGLELMSIPKIKEVKVRRLKKLRKRSASQEDKQRSFRTEKTRRSKSAEHPTIARLEKP